MTNTNFSYVQDEKDVLNAVVKIETSFLIPNYRTPWKTADGARSTGSGFICEFNEKRYLITNAHVVHLATYIRVKLAASDTSFEARTKIIAHDCD